MARGGKGATAPTKSVVGTRPEDGWGIKKRMTDDGISSAVDSCTARMQDVFKEFCYFGHTSKSGPALMTGGKFAKLCKDCKLIDKKLTPTDVDIIFNKVKPKHEKMIGWKQFDAALFLIAEKKFPLEGQVGVIKGMIMESHGPSTASSTKVVDRGGVTRLTDVHKFTGIQKARFGLDKKKSGGGKSTKTKKAKKHDSDDDFDEEE